MNKLKKLANSFKKLGKKVLIPVILLIFVLVGFFFFNARQNSASQTPDMMLATVQKGDLVVRVSGTGSVEAALQEEVRTRTNGTILQYNMKEGQEVAEGELLAVLDVQDLSLQIERAQLDVAIQESDLAKLRDEKTLASISSPTDGTIQWTVSKGDRVQENQVIANVQKRDVLEITGKFNSTQLANIRVGQAAEVFLQEFLTSVPARITDINTSGTATGTGAVLYDVKAELENPGGLDTGMIGTLTVKTDNGEHRSVQNTALALSEAITVRAPIAGEIIAVLKDSGSSVDGGQGIGEISDPNRHEQISNQIYTAELRLKQARLDLQDKQEQQLDRIDYSRVLAPISGTIVLPSQAKGIGDDVSQGNVLGTIVDYSQMQVVIPVDELDVVKVKPGLEVSITADALAGQNIKGTVISVATHGIGQSGVATFDVTIEIEPVDGLRVGMTVNADIIVENRNDTLLVPIEAVQQQGGRSIVMLAAGEEEGQARPIEVKTGAYDTSRIEILEGLSEGQRIIIQGISGSGFYGNRGGAMVMPAGGMGGGMPGGQPGVRVREGGQ